MNSIQINEDVWKVEAKDLLKKINLIKDASHRSRGQILADLAKNALKSIIFPDRLEKVPMPKTTIYDYVYQCSKDCMDEDIFTYGRTKITAREFFRKVEEVAKGLKKYGVKEGEYVGISMPTSPEALIELMAVLKIGAVAQEIDITTPAEGLKHDFNKSNIRVAFINEHNVEKVKSLMNETPLETCIYSSLSDSLPLGDDFHTNFPFLDDDFALFPIENFNPNDNRFKHLSEFVSFGKDYSGKTEAPYKPNTPAIKVQTGGTTGKSKGAIMSNENIVSIPFRYALASPTDISGFSMLGFLPQFIITGVAAGMLLPICLGWKNHLIPTFETKYMNKMVNHYRPNIIMGAPSYFKELDEGVKSGEVTDLSYGFLMIAAGDKINKITQMKSSELYKTVGYPFGVGQGYGSTEVASIATVTDPMKLVFGSAGKPAPQTPVKIFDKETNEAVPDGKFGEVRISGPGVMLSYDDEKETEKTKWTDSDGKTWICTGDNGTMHNGHLYIGGRFKEVILRVGYNIYPNILEDFMLKPEVSKDMIARCKVVGVPSEEFGQVPVAHLVLSEEFQDKQEEIKTRIIDSFSKSTIAPFSWPVDYVFWKPEEYPLTKGAQKDNALALVDFTLEKTPSTDKSMGYTKKHGSIRHA